MFAIVITGPDDFHERHTFASDEVSIGRARINDLALDHASVANFHAALLSDARGFQIVSVEQPATASLRINDRPVSTPCPVAIGDRIGIGELTIVIEPVGIEVSTTPDEVEDGLIRSIEAERDVASREVYADWLEEHGQSARAEFIRLQLRALDLAAHSFDLAQVRLRELATAIDQRWRIRIACPQIDCTVANSSCPYHWGALEPTENPSVRWCRTCECDVHYCLSTNEIRAVRGDRVRVARDLLLDEGDDRDAVTGRRWRCNVCGFDLRKVNRNNQICPRCGDRVG